jgi:hypothetical protein
MATLFKNKLEAGIGTTEIEVIDIGALARATVIGMSFSNQTADVVLVSIRIENTAEAPPNNSAYFVKNIIVPPNQSLRVINGGEKLVLSGNMKVHVQASIDDSLDMVASYVEIV